MNKHKNGASRWQLLALAAALVAMPAAAQRAAERPADSKAQRALDREDQEAWLISGTFGAAFGPGSVPVSIQLGAAPMAITLPGQVTLGRGQLITLSVARQFRGRDEDEQARAARLQRAEQARREGRKPEDEEERHPWRLELEGLQAGVKRTGVQAGIVSAGLKDEVDVQGLYLNALLRVARTEKSQWWLGGGIGRVTVSVPNASAVVPGCGCLPAGDADGTSWRLKLRGEWPVSEDAALVAEAGVARVPSLSTGALPNPVTSYGGMSLRTLTVGLRARF